MKVLVGAGVLVGGLMSGCAARPFPIDLFTVDGRSADYPVMLSRAPAGRGGRPVEARSGTHKESSSQTFTTANATVTITHVAESESEMSASTKLLAQVQRQDRWLQLDSVVFEATDFAGYASASADRELRLRGTVQR